MKIYLLLILILSTGLLLSFQPNVEYNYELEYGCRGTYYPDQPGKDITYNDLLDVFMGISSNSVQQDSIWLILNFYSDAYQKLLRLEGTGLSIRKGNYRLGYMYMRESGWGSDSNILVHILHGKNHRKPVVLSYNFGGIFIEREKAGGRGQFRLGGNEYNGLCSELSWRRQSGDLSNHLGLIFMGRDNFYQHGMVGFNYEGNFRRKSNWLYMALSSQLLISHSDITKHKVQNTGLIEALVPICGWLITGANTSVRFVDEKPKSRQYTFYLGLHSQLHNLNIIYQKEKWEANNSLSSASSIYWWQMARCLKTGGFATVYFPQFGDNIYEAGIQLSYHK
jgi:hypothetical protein